MDAAYPRLDLKRPVRVVRGARRRGRDPAGRGGGEAAEELVRVARVARVAVAVRVAGGVLLSILLLLHRVQSRRTRRRVIALLLKLEVDKRRTALLGSRPLLQEASPPSLSLSSVSPSTLAHRWGGIEGRYVASA